MQMTVLNTEQKKQRNDAKWSLTMAWKNTITRTDPNIQGIRSMLWRDMNAYIFWQGTR